MAKQEHEAYKHLQRQHNGDLSEGDSSQGVTEYCTCMCIHTPKSIIGHSRLLLGRGRILLLMISTVHSSFLWQ